MEVIDPLPHLKSQPTLPPPTLYTITRDGSMYFTGLHFCLFCVNIQYCIIVVFLSASSNVLTTVSLVSVTFWVRLGILGHSTSVHRFPGAVWLRVLAPPAPCGVWSYPGAATLTAHALRPVLRRRTDGWAGSACRCHASITWHGTRSPCGVLVYHPRGVTGVKRRRIIGRLPRTNADASLLLPLVCVSLGG